MSYVPLFIFGFFMFIFMINANVQGSIYRGLGVRRK